MQTIIKDILAELKSAETKHPDWSDHTLIDMAAILSEESGEVIKASIDLQKYNKGSMDDVKTELLQTAAMCIRMLKNIHVYPQQHVSPEKVEMYPIIRWDMRAILDAFKNRYNLQNDQGITAQMNAIPEQEFVDVVNAIMDKATEFINANYIQIL